MLLLLLLLLQVSFPDSASCLTTQPACQQVLRLTIGQLLQDIYAHMKAAAVPAAAAAAQGTAAAAAGADDDKDFTSIQQQLQHMFGGAVQLHASWRRQQQHRHVRWHGKPQLHYRKLHTSSSSSSSSSIKKGLMLYSAHDTSLMPLLAALGQQQRQW
jgi:hypothetical protein